MTFSELKKHLHTLSSLHFYHPDGSPVPAHFHVTEVGLVEKRFIDCGGTSRNEQHISFQLWVAGDDDHRLSPRKFLDILHQAEKAFGLPDVEVSCEYQTDTLGRYRIQASLDGLNLLPIEASCLAPDQCGIPAAKPRIRLSTLTNSCQPGSGCC